MHAAGDALNSLLGNNREPSLREQIEEAATSGESCFSLTYEERIIGFVCCVGSGLFLNWYGGSMKRMLTTNMVTPQVS